MVPVTAFFSGLLALLFLAFSFNVIRGRYAFRLALGDGGHDIMMRRIRVHSNFAEYIPIALILMAVNELSGASSELLSIMGVALVIGRISHAYSLLVFEKKPKGKIIFRQIGMVMTITVIVTLALMAMV